MCCSTRGIGSVRERPDADILLVLVGTGRDAELLRQRLTASVKVVWVDR